MGETASALTTALGYVSTAMSDMATTIADNALMLIGIAGSLTATGLGLFKSATGQRKGRRR